MPSEDTFLSSETHSPQLLTPAQCRLQHPQLLCCYVVALMELQASDGQATLQAVQQHPAVCPCQGNGVKLHLTPDSHGLHYKLLLMELIETMKYMQHTLFMHSVILQNA